MNPMQSPNTGAGRKLFAKHKEPRYWTVGDLLIPDLEVFPRHKTGPRFTVYVDSSTYHPDSLHVLERLLSRIYSTAPRVFVNADKGITIDFDS